jgi:hypothetical protein
LPRAPPWEVGCEGNGPSTPERGDTVRGVIVRVLAVTAVLGGVVFTGAGVAAADQGRPVGGDNSSAPPCGASDIDIAHGCFLGWGRFFQ